MRFSLVVALACVVACGSKSDNSSESKTTNDSKTRAAESRQSLDRQPRSRRPPSTLTVADADKMPLPAGVRKLDEPRLMSQNRVLRTTYCVDGSVDVSAVLTTFTSKMKTSGWQNVRMAAKRAASRRGASGQKGPMRAAVMAQVSEFPNCAKSKQQTRVLVSLYKLAKTPKQLMRETLKARRATLKKTKGSDKPAAEASTK